jgi:hypothetical protein
MERFLDHVMPTVLEIIFGLIVIAFAMAFLWMALDYPESKR